MIAQKSETDGKQGDGSIVPEMKRWNRPLVSLVTNSHLSSYLSQI